MSRDSYVTYAALLPKTNSGHSTRVWVHESSLSQPIPRLPQSQLPYEPQVTPTLYVLITAD